MSRRLLTLGVLAALTGCQPADTGPQDLTATTEPVARPRFEVPRLQRFRDDLAYNSERGIYLIKDARTGAEYFGVSGVGISELGPHHTGKVTQTDER